MALTEKGKNAVFQVEKFFPKEPFTAKELSAVCGQNIVAATLTGAVNNGYLIKLGGSPVQFQTTEGFIELIEALRQEEVSNKGCDNSNLTKAKQAKNDEFYTRFEDIETEVMKYRKQFRDKIVYLPCDDPIKTSAFWDFFVKNFDAFGLKKLIATHYNGDGTKAYKIWIDSDTSGDGYITDEDALQEDLQGDGDFRSPECLEILQECDIICTNPPFSLFREFVSLIMEYKKQFLIIGNQNAFTYKEVFPLIKDNQIWVGYNMVKRFYQPDGSIKTFGNVCWFTNMKTTKREEEIILTRTYDTISYPKYDNYDAIEVSKVINIPKDYYGVMGVPITFLDKYCPQQFKIIGMSASWDESSDMQNIKTSKERRHGPFIQGKEKYRRIFIQLKKG